MTKPVSEWEVVLRACCISLGLLLVSCGGDLARDAERDSEIIQENVKRINEENSTPAPKPDPEMEKACREVSEKEMEEVEAKVRAGEMLDGDDMKVFRCSRYQMWLRGEVSSY